MAVLFLEKAPGFILQKKRDLKKWVRETVMNENRLPGDITFVFENDEEVYKVNVEYLQHDWYTDVISFDYNEGRRVNGDIIISVDRVKENAAKFGTDPEEELRRVMIHGVLHLLGYEDDTDEKKEIMRRREDKYLEEWKKTEGDQQGGKI